MNRKILVPRSCVLKDLLCFAWAYCIECLLAVDSESIESREKTFESPKPER